MLTKITNLLHIAESHRAYFYRLAGIIGVVLVTGGLVTGGKEQTILALIGAVLGVSSNGLAAANTSTKPKSEAGESLVVIAGVLLATFFGLHGHTGG
jgi:hypothetical protein